MIETCRSCDEKITIQQTIPAEDWFILYDWPEKDEYCEEPIICFAVYHAEYTEAGEKILYSGIGPIVEDWSDGNGGIGCTLITSNNRNDHGVVEIYKGQTNRRLWKNKPT